VGLEKTPQNRTAVIVLLLTTVVVGLPLFVGRVLGGQDIVNYLIIAQQTAANLRVGEFLPAWGGGFNAGYGSPLLVFFPPVTGFVNALPVLAGVPVTTGVSVLALLVHLLSGVAFFGWARAAGLKRSALPAAVVYMVAPYRLVDLYLRSALAEHWAFIWPPLILWVAGSKKMRPLSEISLTAVLVAGLLLTNIPLAVLFGIGLAVWFFFSDRPRGRCLEIAAGVFLGFAMASYALIPQAFASTLLNLDACFGPVAEPLRPSANTLFSAGFTVWNLNTVFSLVLLSTFVIAVLAYLLLMPKERAGRGARGAILAAPQSRRALPFAQEPEAIHDARVCRDAESKARPHPRPSRRPVGRPDSAGAGDRVGPGRAPGRDRCVGRRHLFVAGRVIPRDEGVGRRSRGWGLYRPDDRTACPPTSARVPCRALDVGTIPGVGLGPRDFGGRLALYDRIGDRAVPIEKGGHG
jgi:hypothetical protein